MAAVIIAGIIRGPLRDFIGRIKRVNKHGVTMNEGDPAIKTTSSEAAQAENAVKLRGDSEKQCESRDR